MSQVNVYAAGLVASSPVACAFLSLEVLLGIPVRTRPLAQLPTAQPLRLGAQYAELTGVVERLVEIGEALTRHEDGYWVLEAEQRGGLLAERDALVARKRALEQALRALKAGPADA